MNSAKPPPKPAAGWIFSLGVGVAVALVFFAFHVLDGHLHPPRNGQVGGQSAADSTSPKIAPLPPLNSFIPTPRHEALLRVFVSDVLTFTLLHEMGHMVFSQYHVPVGSADTEESAADSFAAAIMTKNVGGGTGAPHNGLASIALFWDALHTLQQTSAPGQYDWADVHQQSEQRAIKLACLLYGANPLAFADIAARFNLQDHRDACIADAAKNQNDWGSVISLNLDPDAGKLLDQWAPHVAVLYHEVPEGLPNGLSATLSRERQIVQNLGILDFVGRNLLLLKTPPDVVVGFGQLELTKKKVDQVGTGKIPLSSVLQNPDFSPMPHVAHPAEGDPLFAFNYTVVGDSCLDDKGQPISNAFWESKSKSITLCYGFVAMVEYIGRRLLAESH